MIALLYVGRRKTSRYCNRRDRKKCIIYIRTVSIKSARVTGIALGAGEGFSFLMNNVRHGVSMSCSTTRVDFSVAGKALRTKSRVRSECATEYAYI